MPKPDSSRLLTLKEVVAEVERLTGRRLRFETVYRWVVNGVSGQKLPTISIGRCRYVAKDALHRFFEDVAEARAQRARPGTRPAVVMRTPRQRKKAAERAAAELAARGA